MEGFVFKGVELRDDKILFSELKRIFGIGFARAKYLCATVGLSIYNRAKHLNDYYFELLSFLIRTYYGTDMFLMRLDDNKRRDFLAFKSYKAIRFVAGLPIRGQRTRSNSRTSKALKIDFKYKY